MDAALAFALPDDWAAWLDRNHATQPELWLRLYRKDSGVASITWEQAVIEALAYGWIDGVKRSGDETSWFQRFTPRRPKSVWSKKNTSHIEKLIAEGRMRPAGMVQVDAAHADGRWDAAYSMKDVEVPADFLAAVAAHSVAAAAYQTLTASSRFAIHYRLTSAKKPETRAKRFADLFATLARGDRAPANGGDRRRPHFGSD